MRTVECLCKKSKQKESQKNQIKTHIGCLFSLCTVPYCVVLGIRCSDTGLYKNMSTYTCCMPTGSAEIPWTGLQHGQLQHPGAAPASGTLQRRQKPHQGHPRPRSCYWRLQLRPVRLPVWQPQLPWFDHFWAEQSAGEKEAWGPCLRQLHAQGEEHGLRWWQGRCWGRWRITVWCMWVHCGWEITDILFTCL